jgi:hypothetical protein
MAVIDFAAKDAARKYYLQRKPRSLKKYQTPRPSIQQVENTPTIRSTDKIRRVLQI